MKIKLALLYPKWRLDLWMTKRIMKKHRKDPEKYEAQWKFNRAIKKAIKLLKWTNIKLKVIGYENLPKGVALLTPNHQSNIDPILIIAAMKKQTQEVDVHSKMCLFLAKQEIKKNKSFYKWTEYLESSYIDRKNPKTALIAFDQIAKRAKKDKKYIVIFPEGTRSRDGEIAKFIPGVFRIAKKEFIPIVPVTINNSYSFSDLSRKGKLEITIIFHPKIRPSQFMTQETMYIAKRVEKIVKSKWVKPINKKQKNKNLLNA